MNRNSFIDTNSGQLKPNRNGADSLWKLFLNERKKLETKKKQIYEKFS